MPFTLSMPKLSPTMEEGTIAKWHVKEGDEVKSGDLLLEVATDKATVEHNALDGGWIRKILVQEGQEAAVNQAIAILTEQKEESIEGYQPEGIRGEEEEAAEADEKPSEERKSGQKEALPAKKEGMLQPRFVPEPPLEGYVFDRPTDEIADRIKASPLAKKIAREEGLDLGSVKGTGPSGRIVSHDLEKAQKTGVVVFGRREAPKQAPGSFVEESLSPIRKVIADRLQQAKTFIPHFYVSQSVQVEAMIAARDQLRSVGIKVSFNDFVLRAVALALRDHPEVNSGFNSETSSIVRFQTVDVSVAVSLPSGLITPIIRHADYKNLGEISVEARYLAKKAREGKLKLEEYKGGSFTVSNLGMYGVTEFQAIINPPQAAILAVGGILNVPVVKEGRVVPGKIMNISLSCDHRVIDGVLAATFIKAVQKYLENPAALLV